MQGKRFSIGLRTALVIFTVTLLASSSWAGAQEKVLRSFNTLGTDGYRPYAGLIMDAAGNLYGTTTFGGVHGFGTVFELSPEEGGSWTQKVLHNFNNNGRDGAGPNAGLIFDAAGNLYGTTNFGGIHECAEVGCGTVFELTPQDGGGWTERVLHSFGHGNDGHEPNAALILDAAGNLYGTTVEGGIHSDGTVFELTPNGSGGWTEKVLHSFGHGTDGVEPVAGLVMDAAGDLYGTTNLGGIHNFGTAFQLAPQEGGSWTETVLHSFGSNTDGTYPWASLTFDAAGNLYGTTVAGGIHTFGTVFELSPQQGGGWTEKVLRSFNASGGDGYEPYAGLILDAAGNLYGTTYYGGIHDFGTAFELSPREGGGWTEKVLHSFNNNGSDGADPYAGLIFDAAGNLYGTTSFGGIHGGGTVFEIIL